MRRLPENQRWLAFGLLQGGSTQADVTRQLNVSQSVISQLWNCHPQTGNVTDIRPPACNNPTTRSPVGHISLEKQTPECHTTSAPTLPGYRGAGLYPDSEKPAARS